MGFFPGSGAKYVFCLNPVKNEIGSFSPLEYCRVFAAVVHISWSPLQDAGNFLRKARMSSSAVWRAVSMFRNFFGLRSMLCGTRLMMTSFCK